MNEGFSLKRKIFNDYTFIEALRSLSSQPLFVKTAWNVNRIVKQAQKYIDQGQGEVKTILDKYVVKDENGKYKMKEDGGDFEFTDETAFKEEYEAFLDQEVHFKSYKLSLDVLETEQVKLTAAQLDILEPILH